MIGRSHISRFLSLLLLVALIASCGGGQRNFNKQKFTNLKSLKQSAVEGNEDLVETQEMDAYLDEPAIETVAIVDQAESQVTIETEEEPAIIAVEETPEETKEVQRRGYRPGHRNDFEKLDEEEKRQRIIDFNRSFNNILIIFLIALAFIALAPINLLYAIPGGIFLVVAWIYSFIPLLRLKRIDKTKYSKQLQVRLKWMRVLKIVGMIICIGFITPGLILLILWLSRVF